MKNDKKELFEKMMHDRIYATIADFLESTEPAEEKELLRISKSVLEEVSTAFIDYASENNIKFANNNTYVDTLKEFEFGLALAISNLKDLYNKTNDLLRDSGSGD